ncbi:MAG: ABC transporter permease, partial [Oscillospiraceae bacterium]|nr:ABC transporter permease [Oscillospiraceae bacterium]
MKKLTVNTLALGNLKQRRKQYTIMIIGIILAMVFSSSIVLFMFSATETSREEGAKQQGKQSGVIYSEALGEKEYKEALSKGLIDDYAFAHTLGYAYAEKDAKQLGASLCWLDDKAKEISYQIVNEGKLPENENEIAAEKNALVRIGYKDAKIGDTISIYLDVQNGKDYLKTVKKEYKLVGILADKKSNIEYRYSGTDNYEKLIPGFFVADNSKVEAGGKEKLAAYIMADFSKPENERSFREFLEGLTSDYDFNCVNNSIYMLGSFDDLFTGGDYFFLVILVLVFASCVAIVNAFNTNLKERKGQIGLLRAVGTTRKQIIKIFGREAFIITLICVPVSILLSYGIVRILLSVIAEEAVMTKSIWALPVSAALNIAVVMLASLIPLYNASKITPMQAIRNINNTRKVKTKKIKTKMQYDAPSHIAKRNLKFYNSSRVAVSVMLASTIIFSCFGFSVIKYMKEGIYTIPYDYIIYTTDMPEIEKQNIAEMPYFSEVTGKKELNIVAEYDKIDDFFRVMNTDAFISYGENEPSSTAEFKEAIINGDTVRNYNERKNDLGIKNEFFDTVLIAFEKEDLEKLSNAVFDGKVDLSKLDSGEEILLVVPGKAELMAYYTDKGSGYTIHSDDTVGKKETRLKSILTAESSYKAGDTVTIGAIEEVFDEKSDTYSTKAENRKDVKIGAIIRPHDAQNLADGVYSSFCVITSKNGMENFKKGVGYDAIYINCIDEIDDEKDLEITEELGVYSQKYDAYVESNYSYNKFRLEQYYAALTAMISIIIICFVICASVINNSISARIRENKRIIGTLRAVGASQSDLTKSYIIQMLSMFGCGVVTGYAVYLAGFLI